MTKICRICGIEKPLDEFHKDRSNKIDGHKNFCKECIAERRKTPMTNTKDESLVCSKCKTTKPRSEFAVCSRTVRGVQDWCKNCMKKYHSEYVRKNREKLRIKAKEWYNLKPRAWAGMTLRSHAKRGHVVEMTIDDLDSIAQRATNCPICGIKLSWGKKNGRIRPDSPSLDRINNEKSLTVGNVWIICARCNFAKGESSMNEFIDYCKNVIERNEVAA